jgi:hypothetical protein
LFHHLLIVVAVASVEVGCADTTGAPPRSTSYGPNAGMIRDSVGDTHGGGDMPGKGRGGEHDRHALVHK